MAQNSTCDLAEFLNHDRPFDYVIVGGGTSGLVLAARLTENPNIQVGVIEAGKLRLGDQNVESPPGIAAMLHNPEYDWNYHSVPQTSNKNKVHHVARGKLLGGSSAVNFLTYIRPSAADINSWTSENPSWSWDKLEPYFHKSETLQEPPNHENLPDAFAWDAKFHGKTGPIQLTFPPTRAPIEDCFIKAMDETTNIGRPNDPFSGDHLGFFESLSTIDRRSGVSRSYSATGYLAPSLERKNLRVLTDATACEVLLEKTNNGTSPAIKAKGVKFWHSGSLHEAFAKREVILCSSTIQSPRLLELSGIGNPQVLSAAGIDCVVPLPEVGENLQEHPMTTPEYEMAGEENITIDSLFQDQTLLQEHLRRLMENQDGLLAGSMGLMGFVPYATQVSQEILEKTISHILCTKDDDENKFQETQRQHIVSNLRSPHSANIQFIGVPAHFDIEKGHADQSLTMPGAPGTSPCYTLLISTMYPVSRGRTHIQPLSSSSSPEDRFPPRVDLGLLTNPADVDVMAAGLMCADKAFSGSRHLDSKIGARVRPPSTVNTQDLDQVREYVQDQVMIYNHILGTCAMGQVVDERLRVQGVGGLRVVDASVIPAQVSGNIVATVYAVAERAADIIKEDY